MFFDLKVLVILKLLVLVGLITLSSYMRKHLKTEDISQHLLKEKEHVRIP